jgi:hypothetical protein
MMMSPRLVSHHMGLSSSRHRSIDHFLLLRQGLAMSTSSPSMMVTSSLSSSSPVAAVAESPSSDNVGNRVTSKMSSKSRVTSTSSPSPNQRSSVEQATLVDGLGSEKMVEERAPFPALLESSILKSKSVEELLDVRTFLLCGRMEIVMMMTY